MQAVLNRVIGDSPEILEGGAVSVFAVKQT
jgi:hypothetical protein